MNIFYKFTKEQVMFIRHHDFFVNNMLSGNDPLKERIADLMGMEESISVVALKKSEPNVRRNPTQEEMSAIQEKSLRTIIQHGLHHRLFDADQFMDAVKNTEWSELAKPILDQETSLRKTMTP